MDEWEEVIQGEAKKERKVSFNQSFCEDEKNSNKREVVSKTGEKKMNSKDGYIGLKEEIL